MRIQRDRSFLNGVTLFYNIKLQSGRRYKSTTVNDNNCANSVLTSTRRKVDTSTSNILRGSNSANRHSADDSITAFLESGSHHLGWEGSRSNGIDKNVFSAHLAS